MLLDNILKEYSYNIAPNMSFLDIIISAKFQFLYCLKGLIFLKNIPFNKLKEIMLHLMKYIKFLIANIHIIKLFFDIQISLDLI